MHRGTRLGALGAAAVALMAGAPLVAATAGLASAGSQPAYNIVVNAPLSGASAFIGQQHFLPGAVAAAWVINHSGGVLGHKINIVQADDQDDPADGVAAINQAIATDQPVAVVGPSSDTATAVDPVINRAQIVDWCLCGTTQLDHMTWPYIYRPSPSDALLGAAMGYWTHLAGYKRAAFVFMSDTGSQTLVRPSAKTFESLGGKVVINLKIVPDQSNYRSEVEQVLAAHPDVLVGEMDPQTASTFLTDLGQLNHGKLLPLVESDAGASSDFYNTVAKAIGKANASKYISALMVAGSLNSAGYKSFLQAFHATYPGQQPEEFNTNGFDAVIITALAMTEAHSSIPSVWRKDILSLTNGNGPVVETYAQGIAAIKKGEHPHYVGASGPIFFNKYHNASGNFWVIKFSGNAVFHEVRELTPTELAPFLKFG
jgi:ABC-type branched-subunit amino acid transport system substrate-binding protein